MDLLPIVDFDVVPTVFYFPNDNSRKPYIRSNGNIDTAALLRDIFIGDRSPLTIHMNVNDTPIYISENHVLLARAVAATMALHYARAYEELRNEQPFP